MNSLALTGIRKFEFKETQKPTIKNTNDVLLQIRNVGICGSDIHYYTSGKIGDQIIEFPFTIGHECSGIVEKTGSRVTRVKLGDRVAIEPAVSCGKCDQCKKGRRHTCRNLKFLGCPGQLEGCMSEYIVMPQENCYKLSSSMSLVQGALVEPLSIGIYSAAFLENAKEKTIGILGSGPIGLSVLLSSRVKGVKKVFMTDKIEERLITAERAGADWIGNPVLTDIVKEIKNLEPQQLDAVFECCGEQEALEQAVDLLKPGGKLIIVGIPEPNEISFNINKIRRKEISIQNVRRQNNCIQKATDLIANGKINVDFMATHNFKLKDAPLAFEIVEGYRDGVIKALIDFG
jgi:L-iditol 2-dehydrogenase